MVTRTVQAWQLQLGRIVIPQQGSPPRRITKHRLQGAPPTAVVEYAGITRHITYRATDLLTIQDAQ